MAAIVVACSLVGSTVAASPVDGPSQDRAFDGSLALEPSKTLAWSLRMAPLERWTVMFMAEHDDDGKLVCRARDAAGKVLDHQAVAGPVCTLKGVTGRTTETITVSVGNVGSSKVVIGYDFD
jgi:hypothetical protein